MARVVVADTASADQAAILGYLHAKAGARTVNKVRSLFSALYDRLADYPASGPRRPRLGPDIRIGIVSPYIVICRYTPEDRNGAARRSRQTQDHRQVARRRALNFSLCA